MNELIACAVLAPILLFLYIAPALWCLEFWVHEYIRTSTQITYTRFLSSTIHSVLSTFGHKADEGYVFIVLVAYVFAVVGYLQGVCFFGDVYAVLVAIGPLLWVTSTLTALWFILRAVSKRYTSILERIKRIQEFESTLKQRHE